MISYGRQSIGSDDIDAVIKVLKSDYLTQGPILADFERAIAEYCGAKYCVAVSNGTAALHAAVAALNLPERCEGITSTNTFVASANSMLYNDIKPVFADIDPISYNVDEESIKARINSKTRLLIPVHFAGQPCNMAEIKKIADERGLYVIEDAAHAIGSIYRNGDRVGSCKHSDMTTFSFHPVKTITTGEGGAITTNNKELYNRLLMLRSHGITKDPKLLSNNPGPWYYEMQQLGFNFRLCDFQASLGLSQLKKLNSFKQRRREIVAKYNDSFKNLEGFHCPKEHEDYDSCFHLYVAQIEFDLWKTSRNDLMKKLCNEGVGTQVHYIPVHSQPYYKDNFSTKDSDCPNAMKYYSRALSIPLYPAMSDVDVEYVIEKIMKFAMVSE